MLQRICAFSNDGAGGNPAGVWLGAQLPPEAQMQSIAAEVGYSETAFAAKQADGYRVRYFAPQGEVPFCGHATIALGAALAQSEGPARFTLRLNTGEISVEGRREGAGWGAELTSPPTRHGPVDAAEAEAALALFGLEPGDIDARLGLARINGGADHLLIPLGHARLLHEARYAFDRGARFMQAAGLVTVALVWQEAPGRFHARNAFAGHGVYEDPATGAAAAALTGWLRDTGRHQGPVHIRQGEDMGQPSLIHAQATEGAGNPVRVWGATRTLP
ncbi:phenazine biosynthesis family protein [Allgaiera indica]|uniref:Phenazine biosynthesis family protein n=2 Tax=Allgaiera indica TaxID=765699 RepID=A0AAN4UQM4_9RHOB|nr:PhzF family phenazine biosynthesis protein [Allgaiera indica]GHE00880.1 phenazine biosynthesis family protein [Allgaiera indica]